MDPQLHTLTSQSCSWTVLFFIYGLSFFLMGFATIIQARRGSALRLGRCLPYLAVFGLLHGVMEWGYIFIPLHIVEEGLQTWRGFAFNSGHALLLALSYSFLLAFGINLLADTRAWPVWVRFVPVIALAGWIFIFLFTYPGQATATASWLASGDIVARYSLALPGSILGGLAILYQGEELQHLQRRSLRFYLKGSAAALFLYAFAGGLIVPPAPFFPASVFNSNLLLSFGLPPPALRILCSILLAFFIFQLLEIYDAEEHHYRETVRKRETIWREREKIRRDLHDGVIQSIYGLALGLEYTRSMVAEQPAVAKERLRELSQQAEGIIGDLRRYLAGMPRGQELAPEPLALAREVVNSFFRDSKLKVNWRVQGMGQQPLEVEQRDNFYHLLTEVFSNIRRHAQATQVCLQFDYEPDGFKLEVKDNGTGFDSGAPGSGEGLANLRQRATLAGGWLEIASRGGRGTTVTLWLPYTTAEGREPDGHSRGAGR